MLKNGMNPRGNKSINVFEQPAASLMNSFIEEKACNHQTEIIVHKRTDSRQIGIGFNSITFTMEGKTSCAIYLY
jgi:hypothetical protein